jgi:hypothetical protein
MTIGLPSQSITADGETYSPDEVRAILKKLASLGINEDKIIAQINPREAAALKRMGGSGKVNPATGLLSFDDGGGGGDGGGGDGGGGDGGDSGGGGNDGGDSGGGGNDGGDSGGGGNDGGDSGNDNGGGNYGGGWGDDSDNQSSDSWGSGWAGDLSGISSSDFGGAQNGGAFGLSGFGDASAYGGGYGNSYGDLSGASFGSSYGDLSGINAGDFGPSQSDQTAGAFGLNGPADASGYAGGYGGPAGSYGNLSGISAASFGGLSAGMNAAGPEAATTANENETQGNPYGDLSGVLGLGFGPAQSAGPANAGAFGLSGPASASGYNASASNSYGTLGGNPNAGTTANTEGAFGLGGPESAGNYGGAYSGNYGGAQAAGAPSANTSSTSQAATDAPTAASSTSYGPAAPIASSTSYTASPSFWSDPAGWLSAKADYVASHPGQYATNAMMMGVPVVGTVNSISSLLGGPTVGSAMQAGTPAGPADMSADLGGDGSAGRGPLSGLGSSASPVVAAPSLGVVGNPISQTYLDTSGKMLPSIVDANTPLDTAALTRAYLASKANPYRYGYGAESSYYAEGGPVTAPNPPTQTMLSSMPTMAYTDGQGSVGAVAAPPALSGYDMVGSDAPHASPTAPAPAAAAPSFMPPPQRAATYNTNASPVAAPISQNPNMGYSLGLPPLTGLKG